ncbi:MAG: hypothetical protein IRZ00_09420 [Gemmatimonadetes bacterium]|nr:hypothetical protein [Gemmatimonadota bacterium]
MRPRVRRWRTGVVAGALALAGSAAAAGALAGNAAPGAALTGRTVGAAPAAGSVARGAAPTRNGAANVHAGRVAADTVWLENARIRLGFDARTGALVDLTDRRTGQRFVGAGGAQRLWLLDVPGLPDSSLGPASARSFAWRRLPGAEPGVVLEWRDFGLAAAPALRVVATVRLEGAEPMSSWHLAVDSAGTLGIEQVRFPRITGIPALGAGEELAVPRWMGALARDPSALLAGEDGKGARLEWAYPGTMSLQMVALYRRGGAGLYAASDDTLAYRKTFAVWGEPGGARGYELVHPLPDPATPKAHWAMPYAAVVGTFQGDWLTAAERYRAWGTRQVWARESRLKRGLVPQWLLETGMWVWNRGRSPGVVPPALALEKALGLPVSIYWHWWHHGPYDTSFPDYLPPREGVDSFVAAVRTAHAAGLHAMVYMNQRLWCTGTPSWGPEAARAAVKERDGSVREETYNIFDPQRCATMDVTTPFWRAKYAGIADTVLDLYGVDGIYMDQAVLSLVCWDPTHGHPVGGGNYWIGGFRKLAAQIRENAAPGRPVLLAGEGAGEAWLPALDLMLTLQVSQERYTAPNSGWDPIPLFQAVYHDYGVTYGNYSSLVMPPYDELWPAATAPAEPLKLLDTRFRRQFQLEQARAFVWGLQPTIANFRASQLTERPRETAYMMRLARLRARALDYLLYGEFVRPPELRVSVVDVDLSRVSIYAAQRGGPQVSRGRYPAAIAGAFRARDGSIAVAVASIVDEPVTVSFDVDAPAYGLAGGGTIERISEDGRGRFGRFTDGRTPVELRLPAGGATILVFRKEAHR